MSQDQFNVQQRSNIKFQLNFIQLFHILITDIKYQIDWEKNHRENQHHKSHMVCNKPRSKGNKARITGLETPEN